MFLLPKPDQIILALDNNMQYKYIMCNAERIQIL